MTAKSIAFFQTSSLSNPYFSYIIFLLLSHLLSHHSSTIFILELFQEPDIIRPEVADVLDAVAQHGDALGAHAEGEAG